MPWQGTISDSAGRSAAAVPGYRIWVAVLGLAMTSFALPPAWSMDGAILVVSATDGPMPARELEPKIREALGKAGVRFSSTQIANLSNQASRALAEPGGAFDRKICASGQSPCITLIRE